MAAGGPANLLVTVANPDIDTAQRLFKYPGIGLLVVTGGEAVVEAARKHTNKRPDRRRGRQPAGWWMRPRSAARRAGSIVKGASFDNNIICADEKVLIVVDSVADELMRLMEGQQAVKLTAAQAEQLQPLLLKISTSAAKARSAATGSAAMPAKSPRRLACRCRRKPVCCSWKPRQPSVCGD